LNDILIKKQRLSQALGHNRAHILNAYIGSINTQAFTASVDRCRQNVLNVVPLLNRLTIPAVASEHIFDCQEIQLIMKAMNVDLSLEQIQFLWRMYSQRHGVAWMRPRHEVGIALEVAAISITKNNFFNKSEQ
jgi:hypothetical protein